MSDELVALRAYAASQAQQDACYAAYREQRSLRQWADLFRPEIVKAHWDSLNIDEQAPVFAAFLACTDQPYRHRVQLGKWLKAYSAIRRGLVDGERATDIYVNLPEHVTVYRGAPEREDRTVAYGVSWTLNKPIAEQFAARVHAHEPACLMTYRVKVDLVRGYLHERGEAEVLLVVDDEHRGQPGPNVERYAPRD